MRDFEVNLSRVLQTAGLVLAAVIIISLFMHYDTTVKASAVKNAVYVAVFPSLMVLTAFAVVFTVDELRFQGLLHPTRSWTGRNGQNMPELKD